MVRPLAVLCVALLLSLPAAWGQTDGSSADSNSLADNQPADNVTGSAVAARAPGLIVNLARARHRALADERLGAQRSGQTWLLMPESTDAAGTTDSLSNLFGGSISSLIGSFLNSGATGSVGDLLGGTSGGSSSSDFSNLPPEVLQMLANAGIDLNDLQNATQKQKEDSNSEATLSPKTSTRAQTSTTDQTEPTFVVRWADAMLSTVFTAVSVAFRTQDFIGLLKDAFRPIFSPSTAEASQTAGQTYINPDLDVDDSREANNVDEDDTSDGDPPI
jgi:hypothetical protein